MFRKLAVVVVTPLLLAACAREAERADLEVKTGAAAVTALRAAPEAAAEAGTAQFEMVMEMAATGETFEIVATGAFDDAAQQMAMSMDMGSLVERLADAPREVPEGFDGATMELVADGDTAYVKSPLLNLFIGTSGWLSMSAEELGAGAEQLGVGANDPASIVEALRGIGGAPEVVDVDEDVRGVPTTHYRASVSLADALADVPESERVEVQAALEQLGDLEGAEIAVDAWIDADGLPRRMEVDMGSAFGALIGDGATMTMTLDLFGFGEPVDIEVPPAAEVTPISETLAGAFLGS